MLLTLQFLASPSPSAFPLPLQLSEAYEWLMKYKASRKEAELHQAWDLYYHVFKRINKQLHSLTTLELQYVSPALVRAQVGSGGGVGEGWGVEEREDGGGWGGSRGRGSRGGGRVEA